jgi:hypothetical protein
LDRRIRWRDVEDAYADRRQGVFGEYHRLVLVTNGGTRAEVAFSLDELLLRWESVVSLVEERLGRPVPVRPRRDYLRRPLLAHATSWRRRSGRSTVDDRPAQGAGLNRLSR